jgi:hypothetical protein
VNSVNFGAISLYLAFFPIKMLFFSGKTAHFLKDRVNKKKTHRVLTVFYALKTYQAHTHIIINLLKIYFANY